jgi:hypothetical protein
MAREGCISKEHSTSCADGRCKQTACAFGVEHSSLRRRASSSKPHDSGAFAFKVLTTSLLDPLQSYPQLHCHISTANRRRVKSALSRCRRPVELPLLDPHRQLSILLSIHPRRCAQLGMTTRAHLGAIRDWTICERITWRGTR